MTLNRRHPKHGKSRAFFSAALMLSFGADAPAAHAEPAAACTPAPACGFKVLGPASIAVDPATSTGQTTIQLKNVSGATIAKALLQAGDFKSAVTGRDLGAQVLLASPAEGKAESALSIKDLAPEAILPVRITVSGVWEAGLSSAPLLIDGEPLRQTLSATKDRTPFNVRLESTATADSPLHVQSGVDAVLLLKNDDPMSYPYLWTLSFGNSPAIPDPKNVSEKILAASSTTQLRVELPPDLFPGWVAGLLRDERKQGLLEIRAAGGDGKPGARAAKTFPVSLQLARHAGWLTSLVGGIFVAILLAAGGLASLLLNHSVPTAVKRLGVRQQLTRLAERIKRLPEQIDLHIRVELRVMRLELSRRVSAEWVLLPGAADVIDQAAREAVLLEHRVDLIEQIGKRLQHLAAMSSDGPPSLLAREEDKLYARLRVLSQGPVGDPELQLMQAQLGEADTMIDRIENADPRLLDEVNKKARAFWRETFQPVWDRAVTVASPPAGADVAGGKSWAVGLRQQLEPFVIRARRCFGPEETGGGDPSKPIDEKLEWVDTAYAKLELIASYIRFCESATPEQHRSFDQSGYRAPPPRSAGAAAPAGVAGAAVAAGLPPPSGSPVGAGAAAPPTPAAAAALAPDSGSSASLTQRDHFLRALTGTGRHSLADARLLLRQAEEGIFVRQIADQVERGRFAMHVEPHTIQQQEVVVFRLVFDDEKFNGASARGKLDCIWTFTHGQLSIQEKGWTVCHFFPDAGPSDVSVEIRRGAGTLSMHERKGREDDPTMRHLTIQPRGRSSRGERTMLELIQLAVALGATMAALMAGAREQIQKLDVAAGAAVVFGLGFGADVIKNLVARRTTPPAP
jgi:hypothetical protein